MKFNFKLMGLVMLVMLICCVSAASATDVDNITVPDDTDVIEIDDAVDSVDDVESDVANKDVVNQGNLRGPNINGNSVCTYFDSNGVLLSNASNTLTFGGDFYSTTCNFSNFIINRAVTIEANSSNIPTLHDMGFELVNADGISLSGINFVMYAPEDENCILINVEDVNNSNITGNVITYNCSYENSEYYNHVIRVVGGENVTVSGNNITAYLPLKKVDFDQPYPSIYTDKVAGVAVQSSNRFEFTYNTLLVNVSITNYDYPTLDAFIIADSNNSYIGHNTVIEIDNETEEGHNNYLYAIDIYQCYNITVDNNTIVLNSTGGCIIPGTNNGTGAAYGVQLTGGHTGVTISNNNIHTSNNGPNCGIYSQNFLGETSLNITGNTIYVEGNAGDHPWSLVTGMELGDNYAYVAGNIITVKNKAVFNADDNIYGISYSQWCPNEHYYEIFNNTIDVINGNYTVYIMTFASSGEVAYNCLNSTYSCCDDSVYPNEDIYIHDNYCPNCNGANCNC